MKARYHVLRLKWQSENDMSEELTARINDACTVMIEEMDGTRWAHASPAEIVGQSQDRNELVVTVKVSA